MKLQRALPALLVLASGCFDKRPVGPDVSKLSLQIQTSAISLEEQTIAVGATVQLEARLYNATGKEVDAAGVDWRSTEPAVASVTATGLVTGLRVGTTRVIASANRQSDTVRINVAERVTGPVACTASTPPLSLGVGEVHVVTADLGVTLCVEPGATAGEYALIPFHSADVAARELKLTLASAGTNAASGPPTPSLLTPVTLREPQLRLDDALHQRLRETAQQALLPRLRAGVEPMPSARPQLAAVPRVGELLRLNTKVDGDGCTNPDYRTGRVVAVTTRAVVVVDTANPRTGLTDDAAYYRAFGEAFDTLVWKVNTRNFGEPTDIDGNGRVLIFYTRAVNEMTARGADSYVGGFAYNRDLFPTTGKSPCAGSNWAEMFYMLVPDPKGEVNGNVRSVEFVRGTSVGVLAHEFQHLINDSRRLHVNKALVWEQPWLNEGLSHIAEELTFFEAARLGPRQNIGPAELTVPRANAAYNDFQAANVERLIRFLRAPEAASLMGKDELPTRGAAWSFLRYAADRRNGDDAALWMSLVRNPTTAGLDNLRQALGVNPREWMQDWAVSIYTDDARTTGGVTLPVRTPERYTQPSWNFRDLMPALILNGRRIGSYPLRTLSLVSGSTHSLVLKGGGAVYLRFGVPAGARAAVRTTVEELPPPSLLRLALVRTK